MSKQWSVLFDSTQWLDGMLLVGGSQSLSTGERVNHFHTRSTGIAVSVCRMT